MVQVVGTVKVFISQPMRSRTAEEIRQEREKGIAWVAKQLSKAQIEVIDTFFVDFDGNALQFLGKSIMEGLAKCDIALFIGDYAKYRGCAVEHEAAVRYGIHILHFNPAE